MFAWSIDDHVIGMAPSLYVTQKNPHYIDTNQLDMNSWCKIVRLIQIYI